MQQRRRSTAARRRVDVLAKNAARPPVPAKTTTQGTWSVQVALTGSSSFQTLRVVSSRPGIIDQVSAECDGAPLGAIRIQRIDQQAAPPELSVPNGGIGSMTASHFPLVGLNRPPNFGGPLRILPATPFLLPFTEGFEFWVQTDDPTSTAQYRCFLSVVGRFTS